ncbi:Hypothetical predicted protein, partial [Marmota monax]
EAPKNSEKVGDVTKELQEKGCGTKTPSLSSYKGSKDDKHTKKQSGGGGGEGERQREEQPSSSSLLGNKTIKEKNDSAPKKHSSKNSKKVHKSKSRGTEAPPLLPEVRISYCGRAEGAERDPKKEKSKNEHKPSSRKKAEDRIGMAEGDAQTHILAGTVGILKDGVTEVEVGAKINPVHKKGPLLLGAGDFQHLQL